MKKLTIQLTLFITFASHAFALIGTSFSVLFPSKAPVSIDYNLDIAFDFLMIEIVEDIFYFKPFGLRYNKIYGFEVENEPNAKSGWFYGDSLIGYTQLEARIPIGRLYLRLIGGGLLNLNLSLEPIYGNIDRDLAVVNGYDVVYSEINYINTIGLGYLAGAGFGVRYSILSVDLTLTYLYLSSPLELTGTYYYGNSGGTLSQASYSNPNARLKLSGLAVGVGVHILLDFQKAKNYM